MGKIEAVIFDMDGVLIDAKDWHFEALNQALSLFGYAISRYDHLVTYDGLPTRRKLEMLTLERGLPQKLHGFINELKQQYTQEQIYTRCKPQFFHEQALSTLKARGYKLGLGSNSVRDSVDMMLEKSCLMQYFDLTLSNQDVQKPKPDPEIYTMAMDKLGVSAKHTLIVEDNEHGIRAAKASGAYVMEVASVEDVNLSNINEHIALAEGHA